MKTTVVCVALLLLCLVVDVICFQCRQMFSPQHGQRRRSVCPGVRFPPHTILSKVDDSVYFFDLHGSRQHRGHPITLPATKDDNELQQRPPNKLRLILKTITSFPVRYWARFRMLSKRAQRIVMAQCLLLLFMFGGVATNFSAQSSVQPPVEIAYSTFMDLVEQQQQRVDSPRMERLQIGADRISYQIKRPEGGNQKGLPLTIQNQKKVDTSSYMSAFTRQVSASPELLQFLRKHDIGFSAAPAPRTSTVVLAAKSMTTIFYIWFLFRLYKTMAGGRGSDTPGKLAKMSDLPMASFDDIQGIDGAKVEVMELVDTLRNPDKYAILGARAPTGLLLEGPPGCGKTLLARATAAAAGVPLLYCSGSDFVEMFVGRGAARVRKLFERAEKLAPCIIFIDELDALGKSRDSELPGAFGRSNDEAEQTLNQLLTCMDGLDSSRRICVLAATNRRQVLDKALVRPGRFDRIVKLKLPDVKGREAILRVYCIKLPGFEEGEGVDPNRLGALGKGRVVDLGAIAALTDGFSGAELEYLVNEAAIRAVRRVSASLRDGHVNDITPHVEARDFEDSLSDFYETRRNMGGMSFLKSVWKA